MRHVVALLGIGGVGKTTFAYKLLGVSARPGTTLRPGVYRVFLDGHELDIIDTPGQLAVEVANNFAKTWSFKADLVVYMYDLTDEASLRALAEVHTTLIDYNYGVRPFEKAILVGNKRDLAEELGLEVEAEPMAEALEAEGVARISAVRDSPERLLALIAEKLGLGMPAGGV